jgi:hypothetical protein
MELIESVLKKATIEKWLLYWVGEKIKYWTTNNLYSRFGYT